MPCHCASTVRPLPMLYCTEDSLRWRLLDWPLDSVRVLELCESSESVNLNLNLNLARVVSDDLDGVRPRRPHLPHKQLWRWCFCWRLIILCISSWSLTRQRSTWRRCVRIHHRLVRGVFLSSAPHLFQNWLSVQIDRSVVALRTNQLD